MNYYAIQVKTLKEDEYIKRAEKILELRADKQDFFFPKKVMTIKKQGKLIKQEQALFASYIFIASEEIDTQLFNILKSIPNFYRFLPNNQNIQKLEGKDLSLIKHFLQFGKTIEASKVIFDENDRVVVKEGPLKGIEALIIKVDKRKKRARVQVELDNSPFKFDLPYELMEKGSEDASKL